MKFTTLNDCRTEEDVLANYEVAEGYDPNYDEACPICSLCKDVCRDAMQEDASEVAEDTGADYLNVLRWMDANGLHSNVDSIGQIADRFLAENLDLDAIEREANEGSGVKPMLRSTTGGGVNDYWLETPKLADGEAVARDFVFHADARETVLALTRAVRWLRAQLDD